MFIMKMKRFVHYSSACAVRHLVYAVYQTAPSTNNYQIENVRVLVELNVWLSDIQLFRFLFNGPFIDVNDEMSEIGIFYSHFLAIYVCVFACTSRYINEFGQQTMTGLRMKLTRMWNLYENINGNCDGCVGKWSLGCGKERMRSYKGRYKYRVSWYMK